jgi:hypothetical protein
MMQARVKQKTPQFHGAVVIIWHLSACVQSNFKIAPWSERAIRAADHLKKQQLIDFAKSQTNEFHSRAFTQILHATNNTLAHSVSPKRLSRQHAHSSLCSRTFQRIGCRANPRCRRSTRGSFQLPFHAGFAQNRRIEWLQQRGCFYGFQLSIQKLQ